MFNSSEIKDNLERIGEREPRAVDKGVQVSDSAVLSVNPQSPKNISETTKKKEVETRKEWNNDNLKLSVLWVRDHYCGYVWFPKRPVREQGYNGILTYVPVHGGITYAEIEGKGMKYGFDCAHSGDWVSYNPSGHKWTLEEVVAETEKMSRAIQLIAKYEKRYLRNITNKGKAKVIDEYHKELGEPKEAYRVLKNTGFLVLKWAENNKSLREILKIIKKIFEPLFGTNVQYNTKAKCWWVLLRKLRVGGKKR